MTARAVAAQVTQGLGREDRPQVRATDADIHDIAHRLAAPSGPVAGAHAPHQLRHAPVHGLHLARLRQPLPGIGAAQRSVQHRALLGAVHHRAAELRARATGHLAGARQRAKQLDRARIDQILRVVERQSRGAHSQALRASRIRDKGLAQIQAARLREMPGQRFPRRVGATRRSLCRHPFLLGYCGPSYRLAECASPLALYSTTQ